MAKRKSPKPKRPIEQYDHKGKDRKKNPPIALVSPDSDKDPVKKTYSYDLFLLIHSNRIINKKALPVHKISGVRNINEKGVNVIRYESAMVEEV